MKEHGQTTVIFAGVLLVFLALMAFVADGGLYVHHWQQLQVDLDAACVASAIAEKRGLNAYTAFSGSLSDNGVGPEYYDPYEDGPDGQPVRGIKYGPANTFLTGAKGPHNFYLAQFMGIQFMDVAVRSRCTIPQVAILPIAVQEPWYEDSLSLGTVYPILGSGAEAVSYTGNDFAGAVHVQVWCQDINGAPDTNCSEPRFFEPLTESPSANMLKDAITATIHGQTNVVVPPIGMRLPQVSGVSNKYLVQAMEAAGFVPGDHIVVIIYNGEITKPDPGYGSWDNVGVLYFAVAEIVSFDANTMDAKIISGPHYDLSDIEGPRSRTIPWDWNGG